MDGGAAGASTNMPGANASVYTPVAQGAADQSFQTLVNGMFGAAQNGTSPGQFYYPQVQSAVSGITGNPYASLATAKFPWAAQAGSDLGTTQFNWGLGLGGNAATPLGYLGQAYQGGFGPSWNAAASNVMSNPFYGPAMEGAQLGTAYGNDTASNASLAGQNFFSLAGRAPGVADNYASQIAGTAAPLSGLSSRLVQSGFDPQSALYDKLRQQTLDSSNAVNAMSGIAGTPYGAGTTNDALTNFNIGWENQQLGRQAQAANAASGVAGTGASILGNAANTSLNGLTTGLNLAGGAFNLGSGASSLANQSGGLQGNVYLGQQNADLAALKAAATGGLLGADTGNALLSGSGQGLTTGSNLSNMGMSTVENQTLYPYNTFNSMRGSDLSAIGQGINLGNQQYTLPQQTIQDLESYLKLGQSASNISGNLGALGQSELANAASGFGGLLGGANSLFGGSGLLGGGANVSAIGADPGLTGLLTGDPSLDGILTSAIPGTGGGGLLSALPFAAS